MFWRFGFQQPAPLEALLERPDVTLEELLDDSDLLQEASTANAALIRLCV